MEPVSIGPQPNPDRHLLHVSRAVPVRPAAGRSRTAPNHWRRCSVVRRRRRRSLMTPLNISAATADLLLRAAVASQFPSCERSAGRLIFPAYSRRSLSDKRSGDHQSDAF